MRRFAFLGILLFASLGYAAEPLSITAPTSPVQPGWCVRLPVFGLTPADYPQTVVIVGPGKAVGADLLAPVGGSPYVHFSSLESGRYVVAIVVGTRHAQADVTVDGAPQPNPQPGPQPQPNPTPGRLWGLIVVEESKDRTPEQAKVYTSASLRSLLAANKIQWRLLDKDSDVTADLVGWARRGVAEGLPRMFAVSADGGIIYDGPVPSEAATMELVRKAVAK